MTTGKVAVTEGAGKNVATYSFPEDAETKMVQRVALNDSSGAEVAAIATSTKGNPTTQQVTTQEGNAVLLLAPITKNNTGALFTQALNTDGLAFGVLSLTVSEIGVGASLPVQASNDNTNWVTLRVANSLADNETGAITATGLYVVDVPYAFVRLNQTAITSGQTTVTALFTKGHLSKRQLVVGGSNAANSTPPNPVPGAVVARTSNPAAVANGNQYYPLATQVGAQITKPFSIPEAEWNKAGLAISASDQSLVAAAGTGIKNYMTWAYITCKADWTANTIQISDGTTVLHEFDLAAGAGFYPLPQLVSPSKGAANTALVVKATGAVTGTCKINAGGYQAP